MTISIGVAIMRPDHAEGEDLVRDADAALLRAKQSGRNRVVSWPMRRRDFLSVFPTLLLAGCGLFGAPVRPPAGDARGNDVTLFALGLLETGYRFGGKNPEAGLDCSGMVSYVFEKAAGLRLQGSAADIARKGRPVEATELKPGDLVFFNTRRTAPVRTWASTSATGASSMPLGQTAKSARTP